MSQSQLNILKWLLGPVLLAQGKWVRSKTPLLPEPVTIKSGVSGQGQSLKILLLGDSSAAGVGAPTAEQSLLGQLLIQLNSDHQVNYKLLAKTGRTTHDMLEALNLQPAESFDVVITALGVNDVTAQVSVQKWLKLQQTLTQKIAQLFTPQHIIMSGLPPMGDFPALPWPLNSYMGQYADQLDATLQGFCAGEKLLTFLSLRDFPKDIPAATDGFHPGPEVYAVWAEKLVDKISTYRRQ